jgi:hypothetical protein
LRQLAAGTPDPELLTPEARAALTAERIRALSARIDDFTIPPAVIASVELLGRAEEGGRRVYRYALTDLAASTVFTMTVAPDDRIAGIVLGP